MRLSRYFLLLAMVWMIAMTARLYPQFGDGVRIDGRLTTVEDYIEDSCSQRVGPAAQTCLAEAANEAQILLRREQGKSVLLIAYPMTTGRNFDEIIRVIDSMQLTAKHKVATPADWKQGQDVIITGAVSDEDAKTLFRGFVTHKPYLRTTSQPA